jgi:hypothetical protein
MCYPSGVITTGPKLPWPAMTAGPGVFVAVEIGVTTTSFGMLSGDISPMT